MNTERTCFRCRVPERLLWAPVDYQPKLERLRIGNYMALEKCPVCQSLWIFVPWEPYASYPYLVRWEHTQEEWQRLHDLDNGVTLHKWHAAMIVELYETLDEDGIDAVTEHKQRAYGRGPLEQENVSLPNLDALLSKA